jgi:hypothetical protein
MGGRTDPRVQVEVGCILLFWRTYHTLDLPQVRVDATASSNFKLRTASILLGVDYCTNTRRLYCPL